MSATYALLTHFPGPLMPNTHKDKVSLLSSALHNPQSCLYADLSRSTAAMPSCSTALVEHCLHAKLPSCNTALVQHWTCRDFEPCSVYVILLPLC